MFPFDKKINLKCIYSIVRLATLANIISSSVFPKDLVVRKENEHSLLFLFFKIPFFKITNLCKLFSWFSTVGVSGQILDLPICIGFYQYSESLLTSTV